MPSEQIEHLARMPSRAPSAAPPSSTTIGWNVNGTGVNGSGMLICAAAAVSTVTNRPRRHAAARAKSARPAAGRQQRAAVEADRLGPS